MDASRYWFPAVGLSLRLSQFEKYAATMPGRVEAYAYGDHPDADCANEIELGLRLHRDGQEWILSYGTWHPSMEPESPVSWRRIHEAPLKIKVAAVKLLPALLEAIEKSQGEIAEEILQACSAYDETIAKTLNLPPVAQPNSMPTRSYSGPDSLPPPPTASAPSPSRAIRVNQLAKELGVESKAILSKCRDEGLADKVSNHMSMLSLGLAATVREWFRTGGGGISTASSGAAKAEGN